MGGAVSAGEDNDELIDNLVDAGYITTDAVQRVFRAVDRGDYYLPDHRSAAYKDSAWKYENLHLSAPCIYAEVLRALDIKPAMAFLNLGSGTGYLSTLVGLLLGPYGVNHGVERNKDVVEYAQERLKEFFANSRDFDLFDFCEPQFVVGNCLLLESGSPLYDRVYCGAACPEEQENYMKNLLKIGGILVMPLNDQLLQIRRVGEAKWISNKILPVTFATMVLPEEGKKHEQINLPDISVLSLQEACRCAIRRVLRDNIIQEKPNVQIKLKSAPEKQQSKRRTLSGPGLLECDGHRHRSDDDEDDDDAMVTRRPRMLRITRNRSRSRGSASSSSSSGSSSSGIGGAGSGADVDSSQLDWPDIIAMMRNRMLRHTSRNRATVHPQEQDHGLNFDIDEGNGDDDEMVVDNDLCAAPEPPAEAVNGLLVDDKSTPTLSSSSASSSSDQLIKQDKFSRAGESLPSQSTSVDSNVGSLGTNTTSPSIPIGLRLRSVSTNSTSTSCTSGIGSSVDDGTPESSFCREISAGSHTSTSNSRPAHMMSPVDENSGDTGNELKRVAISLSNSDSDEDDDDNSDEDSEDEQYEDASGSPTQICNINVMLADGDMRQHRPKQRASKKKKTQVGPSCKTAMLEKVNALPIPQALKNFLLFFRTEEEQHFGYAGFHTEVDPTGRFITNI